MGGDRFFIARFIALVFRVLLGALLRIFLRAAFRYTKQREATQITNDTDYQHCNGSTRYQIAGNLLTITRLR